MSNTAEGRISACQTVRIPRSSDKSVLSQEQGEAHLPFDTLNETPSAPEWTDRTHRTHGGGKEQHGEKVKARTDRKTPRTTRCTFFRRFIGFPTKFEMRFGSFKRLPSLILLSGHLPHAHLIALLTGDGQSDNQRDKLLKVHLAVAVGVQVFHDFVHGGRVLLGLIARHRARGASE